MRAGDGAGGSKPKKVFDFVIKFRWVFDKRGIFGRVRGKFLLYLGEKAGACYRRVKIVTTSLQIKKTLDFG